MTTVKIYTTPTCSQCARTRAWLSAHAVPYTEFNIVEDSEALRRMIEVSGSRNVPVIQIGDQVFVGFDESEIAACLADQ